MIGVDIVGFTEADPGVLLRNITANAITANPSIAKASVSRLQYFLIVLLMIFLSPFQNRFIPSVEPKTTGKTGGALGLKVMLNLNPNEGPVSRRAPRTRVQHA